VSEQGSPFFFLFASTFRSTPEYFKARDRGRKHIRVNAFAISSQRDYRDLRLNETQLEFGCCLKSERTMLPLHMDRFYGSCTFPVVCRKCAAGALAGAPVATWLPVPFKNLEYLLYARCYSQHPPE